VKKKLRYADKMVFVIASYTVISFWLDEEESEK
jgi:hypothetical protein